MNGLIFLGKMTLKTDYDWYVKTHPDFLLETKNIIEDFKNKYPKFNLLPSNSSHNQIVKEGIDAVLTVYGTIGCEYPLYNKLVINASINNPHIAYDFNHHCWSIKDYEKSIKIIPELIKKMNIDKKKVYEYYFMQNIYKKKNSFFQNINRKTSRDNEFEQATKMINQIRNTKNLEEKIKVTIRKFIHSKNYFSKF